MTSTPAFFAALAAAKRALTPADRDEVEGLDCDKRDDDIGAELAEREGP